MKPKNSGISSNIAKVHISDKGVQMPLKPKVPETPEVVNENKPNIEIHLKRVNEMKNFSQRAEFSMKGENQKRGGYS